MQGASGLITNFRSLYLRSCSSPNLGRQLINSLRELESTFGSIIIIIGGAVLGP
jgi:hypothetical protein